MNVLTLREPSFVAKQVNAGPVALAAGLTTSAVISTGIEVDKRAVVAGKRFEGVMLALPVQAVLDSGQSLAVTLTLNHASGTATGGTFSTGTGYAQAVTTITNSTTTTGVTVRGVATVSANCVSAKNWLKAHVSALGSAADTGGDQAASQLTMTFFGPSEGAP